jgi:hypothetical protein
MALVLDGDNGIVGVLVTNADGDVTIDTNTFFVDADNNRVGIGTTSPGETLEVNGNMFINVASGNPNLTIKTAGAGNNPFARLQADSTYWDILGVFSSANDPLHFQYGGSDKMVITNSGNVGIGETNPAEKLEVSGNIKLDTGATQYIDFKSGTSGAINYRIYNGIGWNSDAMLIYDHTNDATILTIEPGKLGINRGSSSLTQAFEVGGGAWISGNVGIIQDLNIGNNDSSNPLSKLRFGATQYGAADIRPSDEGAHKVGLDFYTDATGDVTINPTFAMRIDGSGNVGINTTGPLAQLEIDPVAVDTPIFAIRRDDSTTIPLFKFFQDSSVAQGTGHAHINTGNRDLSITADANSTKNLGIYLTTTGSVGLGTTDANNATLTVYGPADKPALLLSNADGGANAYANRQNRYLTSNGSNWLADGRDPIAVISTNSDLTDKFPSNGLVFHNESQTDNTFSPPIMFGNKSNSAAYNTAYAYIAGRKVGQGVDSNWSAGELWIDTAGTKHNGNNQYMDHSPAIKVRRTGTVDMRWQPFSYGTFNGTVASNSEGFQMTPQVTQGLSYNNNGSHGWGFTVQEAGYYLCFGTSLYAPGASGYVYFGWCLNGAQQHHWHSNHAISSNHDFVTSMIRWCNVGDHLSIENTAASISTVWGGAHSQYYIYKVG